MRKTILMTAVAVVMASALSGCISKGDTEDTILDYVTDNNITTDIPADFNITQDLQDNVLNTLDAELSEYGGEMCANIDAWIIPERKNYVAVSLVKDQLEGRLENRVLNVFQEEIATGRICLPVFVNNTDNNISHSINVYYFYQWEESKRIAKVMFPTVVQPMHNDETIINITMQVELNGTTVQEVNTTAVLE